MLSRFDTTGKRIAFLAAYSAALFIAVLFVLFFSAKTYTLYFDLSQIDNEYSAIRLEQEGEGRVRQLSFSRDDRELAVKVGAERRGFTQLWIFCTHAEDAELEDTFGSSLYVTRYGQIFSNSDYDFTGLSFQCGATAFLLLSYAVFFIIWYIDGKKRRYFSYKNVLDLGLGIYHAIEGLIVFALFIVSLFNKYDSARLFYFLTIYITSGIVLVSIPFVVVFAVALSVSNISLIYHEGFRFPHVLGFVLSAFLMLMSGMIIISVLVNPDYLMLEPKDIFMAVSRSAMSSMFFYFECIMLAIVSSCILAGKRTLAYDKDYLIILGCGIRPDGTLYPLLRGRVDNAIDFYNAQLESTGKDAVFIPSGGKGNDEPIAEAEAMKLYLTERGIPEDHIIPETESVNTFENMKFSKRIIDSRAEAPKVAFSTTNYHVFRSGVIADDAGLNAEGIGSKTRWYFWPNAEVREFFGLLFRQRRIHIMISAALILLSMLYAHITPIMNILIGG